MLMMNYSKTDHSFPRVAVVGCGAWGKNLVRNFAELGAGLNRLGKHRSGNFEGFDYRATPIAALRVEQLRS